MAFSKYKWLAGCFLLVAACSSFDAEHSNKLVISHEAGKCIINQANEKILDVPQDLRLFASQINGKDLRSRQKELNKKFDRLFFSPWTSKNKEISPASFSGDYFGENLHKLSQKDVEYIRNNIKYRSPIKEKGIIIRNTMAKLWPTESQLFSNLKNPGDSYPFDSNIQSLMRLGTPVKIAAISQDELWAFVSSYAFSGWVSMHDVAYVDKSFIKTYMARPKVVAIKDGIVIRYKGKFLNRADIGTVLVRDKKGLLCPHKNFDGFAKLVSCNASGFSQKPLEFTAQNAIKIAEQFLGQKYGWGGYLNLRDCSMLTMDYCTTFGIPLARNGNAQLSGGGCVNLSKKSTPFISRHGKPFLTLVGYKGHVMLYVGKYRNKPVFLHNVWGAPKTPDRKSRYVIGKTILTTSDFGKNIKETKNCKLADIITVMKFI
ncbi:MAG: SH3 domain-containing protein [Alphaproteobacteria bacterium]|nr:SH3 domain-containing protein [Alphaproteobacteria bacterium]